MAAEPTATQVEGAAAGRPMRADAMKNRQRILDAAAEVFAAHGVSVPIDIVAERAGVGVGTLYRHFPTKEALFEAIVERKVEDLADAAEAAGAAEDPDASFFAFVRQLAREASNKQDLFDALDSAGIDVKARCPGSIARMEAALGALIARAAEAGALRDDVDANDVLGLVVGTCHGARRMGADAATAERLIGICCQGLRPLEPGP